MDTVRYRRPSAVRAAPSRSATTTLSTIHRCQPTPHDSGRRVEPQFHNVSHRHPTPACTSENACRWYGKECHPFIETSPNEGINRKSAALRNLDSATSVCVHRGERPAIDGSILPRIEVQPVVGFRRSTTGPYPAPMLCPTTHVQRHARRSPRISKTRKALSIHTPPVVPDHGRTPNRRAF